MRDERNLDSPSSLLPTVFVLTLHLTDILSLSLGGPSPGKTPDPQANQSTQKMFDMPGFVAAPLLLVLPRNPRAPTITACTPQTQPPSDESKPEIQIAICKGPTCTKDGSKNTSEILSALLSSQKSGQPTCMRTGCLGECGQGPNALLTIGRERPQILHGVRTVHAVGNLLTRVDIWPDEGIVSAVELKHTADVLLHRGEFADAISAYSDAADALTDCLDLHVSVLCNWSGALLESGRVQEALRIANWAVERDAGRPSAWSRKAEAHDRLRETELAVSSWEMWGQLNGRLEDARKFVRRSRRRAWLPF